MLTPYMNYIKLALVVVVFVAGYAVANHLAQGKIDKLNQEVGEYKTAYASLSAATAEQNDSINNLKAEGEARSKASADALEQAQKETQSAKHMAASILAHKPAKGTNLCDAASKAFDEELNAERGVK